MNSNQHLDLELIQRMAQEVEKFKQETEYVCLKLAVKDWATFLAEVRKGQIGKILPNSNNPINIPYLQLQKEPAKEYTPNTTNKVSQALQVLNEVLQVKTTKRNLSKARRCDCECESPICSEEKIKHIKGSDTSRSESSVADAPSFEKEEDPFQKYKIENICGTTTMDSKTIQQLLKGMEDYQKQQKQKQNETQGFETFRKIPLQQTVVESGQKKHNQSTAKKSYNVSNTFQSPSFERVNSQEWIKQTEMQPGMRQFLLALQNTKLRKQITYLQKMLNKNGQYQ